MRLRELGERVRRSAPKELQSGVIDKALRSKYEELDGSTPQEWDVTDVIERAGRLQTAFVAEEKDSSRDRHADPMTSFVPGPRELVLSDQICDVLEPQIQALRQTLFQGDKVPFRSWRKATQWLESTALEERKGARKVDPKKARMAIGRLARSLGCELSLHHRSVEYPMRTKSGLWTGRCMATPGGKLYRLALECERLARPGFAPSAMTWWVLLGIRPLLPRYEVMEQISGAVTSFVLKINAADLSWRELWGIYKALRSMPNTKRQKVNRLHYRIYLLVREKGGVPSNGKVKLWKDVLAEIRRERGLKAPKTWQAVRKAYLALLSSKHASGLLK